MLGFFCWLRYEHLEDGNLLYMTQYAGILKLHYTMIDSHCNYSFGSAFDAPERENGLKTVLCKPASRGDEDQAGRGEGEELAQPGVREVPGGEGFCSAHARHPG